MSIKQKQTINILAGILMTFFGAAAHGADDLFEQHNQMMQEAIRTCDSQRIKKLIATPYVEVNKSLQSGYNYLDFAIIGNCADDQNISMVKILLDNGAEPEGGRDHEVHPIFLDVVIHVPRSSVKVIDLLISHGADVNRKIASLGGNYAHLFAFYGSGPTPQITQPETTEVLKFLHKKGLNLLSLDNKGRSPLIIAAITRANFSYMDYLVKAGVPVNLKDECGWTATDYTQFDSGLKIAPENRNNTPDKVEKSKMFYDYLKAAGGVLQEIPIVDPCISKY